MNQFKNFRFLFPSLVKVPSQLQIHPEIGRSSKILSQAKRRSWRNTSPGVDDFINSLVRHMDCIGKFTLAQTQRFEKFFQKHFSWMCRWAMSWDAYHLHFPGFNQFRKVERWVQPISPRDFIGVECYQIPAFFLMNAKPSRASCIESGKMSRQILVAAAMFGRAEPKASMVR